MKLTFWEVAQATNALNDWHRWPDFELNTIEFDSRMIQNGALFVPLQGANDGHSFVENAIKNGASATFWSSKEETPQALPVIKVENTLLAMQELARYYLKKIGPKVVAITGSNGKTTTKDMTEAVLGQEYKTYKTQGNYNNEIGLPYTILHMDEKTEILILEMGMDHAHEIELLSKIAHPDVAAITMIGEAHIENLGSRAGIAKAKMEIAIGLKEQGLLIIPANEPLLIPHIEKLKQTIQTVGFEEGTSQAEIISSEKKETKFKTKESALVFSIPVPGEYNVTNALIAILIGRWFKLTDEEIKKGLASFKLTKNRTEWLKTKTGSNLLSDVYNANPTAMKVVLDSFSKMMTNGKRIAVLGDMLELGTQSTEMHQSISEHLCPKLISDVVLYGEEMKKLHEKLQTDYDPKHLYYFHENEKKELIDCLKKIMEKEDILVLKASNGMGLSDVVQELLNY